MTPALVWAGVTSVGKAEAEAEHAARQAETERSIRDDYDHYHRGPDVDHGPSLGW